MLTIQDSKKDLQSLVKEADVPQQKLDINSEIKTVKEPRCEIRNLTYTNADLKIYQYLRLHMKIIYWRFHIKHLLVFEICEGKIREKFVYKHSPTIEYVKH